MNQADLDSKTLGSAQVVGSAAGWVTFSFPDPIVVEPNRTYFLFIDSYDFGVLGPDSVWSMSAPGPQPGPFLDGTGWIFVYSWNDNSNYKPELEKHYDYAFRIYYSVR